MCSNVNRSYTCECKTGYSGNGWTCKGNAVKHCELNKDITWPVQPRARKPIRKTIVKAEVCSSQKVKTRKKKKESCFSMKYVFLLFWLEKTKETWFSRTRQLRTIKVEIKCLKFSTLSGHMINYWLRSLGPDGKIFGSLP